VRRLCVGFYLGTRRSFIYYLLELTEGGAMGVYFISLFLFELLFHRRFIVSEILPFVLSKYFCLAPSPFRGFIPFSAILSEPLIF
jgi:hypothetical protein